MAPASSSLRGKGSVDLRFCKFAGPAACALGCLAAASAQPPAEGRAFAIQPAMPSPATAAPSLRGRVRGTAGTQQGAPASSAALMGLGSLAGLMAAAADGRSKHTARRQAAVDQSARTPQLSEVVNWTGLTPGKDYRLQVQTLDSVAADTMTIRSLDWDRDRFDIEFALERGTTYNSYVIKGSEKVAIVDTSHEKFDKLYFEALDKEVDYATVDYLIVSHTEPDHSGLIFKVLEKAAAAGNDKLTVVGSKICIQFLENLCFTPFKSQVVANNQKIDLGGGHELEFLLAPNLHWPDTIFTYDHGTGVLYTCDAFGMHYCSENAYDVEGVKALLPHYGLYYDCLMKPNARSVLTALKKSAGLDFHTVATGHGPMLRDHTKEWVDQYKSWSEDANKKAGPSVALFWVSSFGESERLAQVFAHGLTTSKISMEMHDLRAIDSFELTECVNRNDVLVVTSPPQADEDTAGALGSLVAGAKAKKHRFLVLDSCSAEQEPLDLVRNRFTQQGIPEAMPPIAVMGADVTTQVMQAFEEAGMKLGGALGKKAKKAKGGNKDLDRALARVASSLYIVTAQKKGVRHAMVASWVTPASQRPMGISVAIAKDRAMEPLLRTGDSFVLNLLEEGRSMGLVKHFLQQFAPGADRLEGMDAFEGTNGAPVLREACGYLECRIASRLDAGDHHIAYAEVTGGDVARDDAEIASHHRKIATNY